MDEAAHPAPVTSRTLTEGDSRTASGHDAVDAETRGYDRLVPQASALLARLRGRTRERKVAGPPPPIRLDPPMAILLGAIAVWCGVFGRLVMIRHNNFGSFDFDMGVHDQAIWLMAHYGHGFLTTRGLPVLGFHAMFSYWLLAPLSWLGAGTNTWNLLQVLSVGLVPLPLYLLGRDRLANRWLPLPIALLWLAHPSVQFVTWELFHPEVMGAIWLVGAYVAATRGRWRWYWILLVVALCWKEDFSLAVAMLGVVMILWGQRRRGLITVVVAVVWFLMTVNFMQPRLNGSAIHAGTLYGDLGTSPSEVLKNGIQHPSLVFDRLSHNDAPRYVRDVVTPLGGLSLLSPATLLIGLPMTAINVLSNQSFIFDVKFHYVIIPTLAVAIAAVEGLARVRWRHVRYTLAVFAVVCGMVTTVTQGVSPIASRYRDGWWPLTGGDRVAVKRTAVGIPGGSDSVSATYGLVPHLSRRKYIYSYPNPWRARYWGINGENLDNPNTVEWLVLDRRVLSASDKDLLASIITGPDWRTVFDQSDIVVIHRVHGVVAPH